jgi:transposase
VLNSLTKLFSAVRERAARPRHARIPEQAVSRTVRTASYADAAWALSAVLRKHRLAFLRAWQGFVMSGREALAELVHQLHRLDEAIARLDRTITKMAHKDETAHRLMSIPGFGPITASAMAASVQDASSFA